MGSLRPLVLNLYTYSNYLAEMIRVSCGGTDPDYVALTAKDFYINVTHDKGSPTMEYFDMVSKPGIYADNIYRCIGDITSMPQASDADDRLLKLLSRLKSDDGMRSLRKPVPGAKILGLSQTYELLLDVVRELDTMYIGVFNPTKFIPMTEEETEAYKQDLKTNSPIIEKEVARIIAEGSRKS